MTTPNHGQWFKSSFSAGACACVEVCLTADNILVRDTKEADAHSGQPIVHFTPEQWSQALKTLEDGGECSAADGPIIQINDGGSGMIIDKAAGVVLSFTKPEIVAFLAGVRAGEFRPEAQVLSSTKN